METESKCESGEIYDVPCDDQATHVIRWVPPYLRSEHDEVPSPGRWQKVRMCEACYAARLSELGEDDRKDEIAYFDPLLECNIAWSLIPGLHGEYLILGELPDGIYCLFTVDAKGEADYAEGESVVDAVTAGDCWCWPHPPKHLVSEAAELNTVAPVLCADCSKVVIADPWPEDCGAFALCDKCELKRRIEEKEQDMEYERMEREASERRPK